MTINEICSNGKIESYREEVTSILGKIETKNFRVACNYHDYKSIAEWDFLLVRISLMDSSRGLNIIWDLLHEYGHILDGHPGNNKFDRIIRENVAWDNARKELAEYPRLLIFLPAFEKYRELCLLSYS